MATKDLARTVVEGGRHTFSKNDRTWRNRSERRARFDEDGDLVRGRLRGSAWKEFYDRLTPLYRWVDRQVGRGWNNVYRDFCAMTNRRTTKGRHLEEHLDMLIIRQCHDGGRFYVDPRGILRREPRARQRRTLFAEEQCALDWAGGRQVIEHGSAAFWTLDVLTRPEQSSRQGPRLTDDEMAFWASLRPEVREPLVYAAAARKRLREEAPLARRRRLNRSAAP